MFWNNLIDFCEEMMMMALCTRMPPLLALDRIFGSYPTFKGIVPLSVPQFLITSRHVRAPHWTKTSKLLAFYRILLSEEI